MKIVGIIPARYKSSRFEGKPLADICGKPMIYWVYNQAVKVKDFDSVYVATDDERIINVCNDLNINSIMTRDDHPSGTDRVAEVAEKISADLYVVVMGDEPLIEVETIESIINVMRQNISAYAGLGATKFKNGVDVVNDSTIKLAINDRDELIFMSRAAIPYPKARIDYEFYKNVGVYAFTKEGLNFFKNTPRGVLESIEDMEMLRMLENRKLVKVSYVDTCSMSVDTPKDLDRIIKIKKRELKK